MPWGDRCCRVGDPFGNLWWIMTRVENISPEEEAKRYGEQKYIDALTYFQSTDFFEFAKKYTCAASRDRPRYTTPATANPTNHA
jgi:hypothetical protein